MIFLGKKMGKYLCRVLASVLRVKIILDFGNFLFVCVEWMRQQILELNDFVREKKKELQI